MKAIEVAKKLDIRNKIIPRILRMDDGGLGDLLRYAGDPSIISLSAGAPDPETFPDERIGQLMIHALSSEGYGKNILQYGKSRGFGPLLDILPEYLARPNRQVKTKSENIVVTAGSQEALGLLGEVFLDPAGGSKIAVESPTYIGALGAWKKFNPNYIEIETDKDGIIPEKLEEAFIANPDIKFLYTIPTFQNPTGRTIPLERRKKIAKILKKYGQLAVEDDPYSELRYEGKDIPSLQSLAPENVIHLFTFSKTMAPGLRVGGIVFPENMPREEVEDLVKLHKVGIEIDEKIKEIAEDVIEDEEKNALGEENVVEVFTKVKANLELFTSYLTQAIVADYIKSGEIEKHIQEIREKYKPRRMAMTEAIQEHFPTKYFDVSKPKGGMFIWVSLKKEYQNLASLFDLDKINDEAAKTYKVDFGKGKWFFANKKTGEISMRLNFTNRTEDELRHAIQIIGEMLKQRLPAF